jgi:hypothetical protein
MSYKLIVGDNEVIQPTGSSGQNWDALNSFWLGYNYTIVPQTNEIKIDQGFFAVYVSHGTNKPIQGLRVLEGARIHEEFGMLPDVQLVSSGNDRLRMSGLRYAATEEVECGNEAMQLHLCKFDPKEVGPTQWVSDAEWHAQLDPDRDENRDGTPPWRRRFKFEDGGNEMACFVVWRRTNRQGLKSILTSTPLAPGSVFTEWLRSHDQKFPKFSVETKDDVDNTHWKLTVDPEQKFGDVNPRGVVMIVHGAFSGLKPSDVLANDWLEAFGDDEKITRKLLGVVADFSQNRQTAHVLKNTGINTVVSVMPESPQVIFSLRL